MLAAEENLVIMQSIISYEPIESGSLRWKAYRIESLEKSASMHNAQCTGNFIAKLLFNVSKVGWSLGSTV